jgi:hypothetical protein
MLEGHDWPNNVADCSDCGRRFCANPGCEPAEPGRCKECQQPLCSDHYQEAVIQRRGVCATCAEPVDRGLAEKEPPPSPPRPWQDAIPLPPKPDDWRPGWKRKQKRSLRKIDRGEL